jgi:signal transduction histidine kinase
VEKETLDLLYKLSLAVGQSLDLEESCARFVSALKESLGVERGAVWIREAPGSDRVRRIYSSDGGKGGASVLPCSHPAFGRLGRGEAYLITSNDPAYAEAVTVPTMERGALAVFALDDVGYLQVHHDDPDRLLPVELDRLGPVMARLATALAGCAAIRHLDQKLAEKQDRLETVQEEREVLETKLEHAERMETIGTLTGGIAHDFNNLLAAIQGNVSYLHLELPPGHPLQPALEDIQHQVKSGASLTAQLLGYARKSPEDEDRPVNLARMLKETATIFQRTRKQITIALDVEEELWRAQASTGKVEQVLYNLYVNAAEAMPNGGTMTITAENVGRESIKVPEFHPELERYVKVAISDTGVGMTSEVMESIFQPFFTTKGRGSTGLGLASAHSIVKQHGGALEAESTPDKGSTLTFYLPAATLRTFTPSRPTRQLEQGEGTLLVVDDEEMVLRAQARLLRRLGYKVRLAKGGREALDIYRRLQGEIDLVLLDLIMPEMGGEEAYGRLREIDPRVRVLFTSGYHLDEEAAESACPDCAGFIQKPFDEYELSAKLTSILAPGPRRHEF